MQSTTGGVLPRQAAYATLRRMRALVVAFALVACAGVGPDVAEPEDRGCERYAQMGPEEATRELNAESRDAEKLGAELAAFQKAGVPDDDPRSLAVAVPLGETLVRMFAICSCNEELAQTSDCEMLRSEFGKHFDL